MPIRDVTLAVNVSGTTAGDPCWLQSFINYVRANRASRQPHHRGTDRNRGAATISRRARASSRNLREMGCRVAIDDFGAGYTSFRNLQMLRVDMVKIDGTYRARACRNRPTTRSSCARWSTSPRTSI